jgi:hypothetical protein
LSSCNLHYPAFIVYPISARLQPVEDLYSHSLSFMIAGTFEVETVTDNVRNRGPSPGYGIRVSRHIADHNDRVIT